MSHRLRNAFILGLVVGLVLAIVRVLRHADSQPPALASGSADRFAPASPARPAADLHLTVRGDRRPADTSPPHGDPVAPHSPSEPPSTGTHPEPSDTSPPHGDPVVPHPTGAPLWKEPVGEGDCPTGYPIKAKTSSRIYHVPGGLSYDRTNPERCYATAEAAEADGFRAAKR